MKCWEERANSSKKHYDRRATRHDGLAGMYPGLFSLAVSFTIDISPFTPREGSHVVHPTHTASRQGITLTPDGVDICDV